MASVVGADAKGNGQFFTRPEVAQVCIDFFARYVRPLDEFDLIVEPSAGEGAFYDVLPANRRYGVDIDAEPGSVIERADFLKWAPEYHEQVKRIAVLGNPPFGKAGVLAMAFLNHALSFADYVGLIVPAVLNKRSYLNRVRSDALLVASLPMPHKAFVHGGKDYVPLNTIFQVWRRSTIARPTYALVAQHVDFAFVGAEDGDFGIYRTGLSAGKPYAGEPTDSGFRNRFWIKATGAPLEDVKARFREATPFFLEVASYVVGPRFRCLTQHEVVEGYEAVCTGAVEDAIARYRGTAHFWCAETIGADPGE